ncbi:DUF2375 domain-containing protein [Thalassotalea litorea]|uniref:DUF2375 domain-containing protein n=1 Tax=Thalassotalea litorea TaxID=2020715 RepID=A0A5R9IG87_9GAMM|nr:DUF2375 family protein [Thalassotalea litorea]TLU64302.1 DUF2375 domain-containing protein [Thalassotalea litorea]
MDANNEAITVLYYDQTDMTSICAEVLSNLDVEKNQRVILPQGYRDDKIIVAILDGDCHVRNSLGDRQVYS